jgi:hypothetical protein
MEGSTMRVGGKFIFDFKVVTMKTAEGIEGSSSA